MPRASFSIPGERRRGERRLSPGFAASGCFACFGFASRSLRGVQLDAAFAHERARALAFPVALAGQRCGWNSPCFARACVVFSQRRVGRWLVPSRHASACVSCSSSPRMFSNIPWRAVVAPNEQVCNHGFGLLCRRRQSNSSALRRPRSPEPLRQRHSPPPTPPSDYSFLLMLLLHRVPAFAPPALP